MPSPTVVYDATNGSDTAASGAGPSTAVTGSNADGTGGGTTITLNGTFDFTGVANDGGSDCIWCETTSGERHLFSISSFTGGVSTCTAIVTVDTIGATTFSGKNWAVGGKRKTLENDSSQKDWEDWTSFWQVEFEEGTYTVSATISPTLSTVFSCLKLRKTSAASSKPIITSGTGTFALFTLNSAGKIDFDGLEFRTNGASSGGYACLYFNTNYVTAHVRNCIFRSSGYGIYSTPNRAPIVVYQCRFLEGSGGVRSAFINQFAMDILHCWFQDLTDYAVLYYGNQGASTKVDSCVVWNCTRGIYITVAGGQAYGSITNCTIVGTTNDAILVAGDVYYSSNYFVRNNLLVDSGGYGLNVNSKDIDPIHPIGPNAFYNNTSGSLSSNVSAHADDVTLTADPFVDSSGGDFTLNSTAGGGALVDNEVSQAPTS